MNYPILYSLQHCPYAMRARLGIILAKQCVMLRAIVLKDKPKEMLKVSPKGTVPVLVIENGTLAEKIQFDNKKTNNDQPHQCQVIDESLDIMLWALKQNDPDNLLYSDRPEMLAEMLTFIELYDVEFKTHLDKYKCAKRYHEISIIDHRKECENYINQLEQRLCQHQFLMGEHLSLADYAILPFIRQFAKVERQWYINSPYPKLKQWLKSHLASPLFSKVMALHPLWLENHEIVLFGMEKR